MYRGLGAQRRGALAFLPFLFFLFYFFSFQFSLFTFYFFLSIFLHHFSILINPSKSNLYFKNIAKATMYRGLGTQWRGALAFHIN